MWMAGGGIRKGQVLGETDEIGLRGIDKRAHVTDIHATILHAMGLKFGIHVMRGIPRQAVKANAPIEGGPRSVGDRHVLVVDRDHWKLYEMFSSRREGVGWRASSGAVFDLNSNKLRPAGWTSADAAG